MADNMKAVAVYSPRVRKGPMVEMDELVSFIEGRSAFNEGALWNVLTELRDAVTFFALRGRPVRLKGLGFFSPKIDRRGVYGVNYVADKYLKSELNAQGKFDGTVVNRDMIGKTVEEMVERWNKEHPDDKIKDKK